MAGPGPTDKDLEALGFKTIPKSVVLLGLGPSHQSYVGEVLCHLGQPWAEEVWTINGGAVAFQCDRCFSIADLRTDLHKWPHWAKWLTSSASSRIPIYTSKRYPEFPSTIEYPLETLRKFIQFDLVFCNTGPMALAMAMWLGIKEVWMFGIDYTYPNIHLAEQGGQAFAFLLGMCKMMGVEFHIPHTSSLLGAVYQIKGTENGQMMMKPYGYRDAHINLTNGKGDLNVIRQEGNGLRQANGQEVPQASPADSGTPPVQVLHDGPSAPEILPALGQGVLR